MDAVVGALTGLPPWLVLGLVFLLPALEASAFVGLVVPGEVAVIIGGVVAHGGGLPLWAVIVAAVAGAVIGDQVGYLVGRRFGPGLLTRLPARVNRSGEVDRALGVLRRRGAPAVALGRWVAALRALVPGLAGMSGMRRLPFTVANVLGGTLWATAIAVLGYLAGASYRALEQRLGLGGEITFGVLVLLGLAFWWRARRRRANARAPGADREPDPAP
jgi:membrane-associated protein